MAPAIVFGGPDLGMDEAVDGFVTDDRATVFERQPPSHLLGRPPHGKAGQHSLLQVRLAFEPAAAPSPGPCQLIGVGGLIAHAVSYIAGYFARDRRGARDPSLQRFSCTIARFHADGQSYSALPARADGSFPPWRQYLSRVLHFVCELKGS